MTWCLKSVLILKCDVCGDSRQLSGVSDRMVRDEAKRLGWVRRRGEHPHVLCRVCQKETSREH